MGGAAETVHTSGRGRWNNRRKVHVPGTFSAAADDDEVWSEIVPGPLRHPCSLRLRLPVVIRDRRIGGEDVAIH